MYYFKFLVVYLFFLYLCGIIRKPVGRQKNPMQIGLLDRATSVALSISNNTLISFMVTKVNILIDGGFFDVRFKKLSGRNATVHDVEQLVSDIMAAMRAKTNGETDDILFRAYYYDCKPFGGTIKDYTGTSLINYSASATFTNKSKYLEDVAKLERFALRLGELSFTGWKQDIHSHKWKPDFKQKSVDMKFGLDIATMATKHTVDKIVLVAGDSDFIAPIKMARKEGLLVYLHPMGNHIKDTLLQHSDYIL